MDVQVIRTSVLGVVWSWLILALVIGENESEILKMVKNEVASV